MSLAILKDDVLFSVAFGNEKRLFGKEGSSRSSGPLGNSLREEMINEREPRASFVTLAASLANSAPGEMNDGFLPVHVVQLDSKIASACQDD